jgi:putative hydrolase of the HAD superfamily
MSLRFKAVTFDLWNTLIREVADEIRESRAERVRAALMDQGVSLEHQTARQAVDHAWGFHRAGWKRGEAIRVEAAAEQARLFLELPKSELVSRSIVEGLEWMMPASRLRMTPGVHSALGNLREAGLYIGLVSDSGFSPGAILRERLEELGLAQFFSGMTFSDETGLCKPHKAMFLDSLEYLDAAASEAVHVGDLYRNDVLGAREAGFSTVRFNGWKNDTSGDADADADYVTGDLADAGRWILSA